MLTERQRAHYEAFGFLFLRELFSADEMSAIGKEADRIWEEESRQPDFRRSDEGSQHTSPFVEISSTLSKYRRGRPDLPDGSRTRRGGHGLDEFGG